MKIYLVMVDTAGNMRSSEDTPKGAFFSKEEALNFINKHTITYQDKFGPSVSVCGGYSAVIKEVELYEGSKLVVSKESQERPGL